MPDLNRHLAACDIGLMQGGLTTTMFPLRDHGEHQFHVRRRLQQYRRVPHGLRRGAAGRDRRGSYKHESAYR